MTDKLTRIKLPMQTSFPGLLEWGEKSPREMIALVRDHARRLREEADAIDQATDLDFKIDVVRGSIVQHHVKALQRGKV